MFEWVTDNEDTSITVLLHTPVSLRDWVMNINQLVAVSLGIEMALNGLDIGLTVSVTLETITCYDSMCTAIVT